jgi:pimeloyl-ACP methyl ester carboxylesterase
VADEAPLMDDVFEVSGLRLSCHVANPAIVSAKPVAVVLCHGFPVRGRESPASGKSFPELADRIANEMGWLAMAMNFRGCGRSEGNFSLSGWLDDIAAAVDHVLGLGAQDIWLAGFGSGGALCICEGARNQVVTGVAAMSAPADFSDWARDPRRLLLHARQVGVVKDPAFPPSLERWAQDLKEISSISGAPKLAPRPLLLIHGDSDDLVPSLDARLLADVHGSAELRIIPGAGHELRHDPRAIAVLLGWLSRLQNARVAR